MSIGVTYSTKLDAYRIYTERTVDDLVQQLLRADLEVGFNVINFDYEVLMGYTILDLPHQCHTLDILVEIEKALGHRLGLDSLAIAILVVRLEETLGLDPFTESTDMAYPVTLGDFVRFYEHAAERHGVDSRQAG